MLVSVVTGIKHKRSWSLLSYFQHISLFLFNTSFPLNFAASSSFLRIVFVCVLWGQSTIFFVLSTSNPSLDISTFVLFLLLRLCSRVEFLQYSCLLTSCPSALHPEILQPSPSSPSRDTSLSSFYTFTACTWSFISLPQILLPHLPPIASYSHLYWGASHNIRPASSHWQYLNHWHLPPLFFPLPSFPPHFLPFEYRLIMILLLSLLSCLRSPHNILIKSVACRS